MAESRLTIDLETDDGLVSYDNDNRIISYSLESQFTTAADGWSISVYDDEDPRDLRRKFAPLTPVTLYIDGKPQLLGRIDRTSGAGTGSVLNVSGRDYLADLADAGVDPTLKLKKEETVESSILKVTRPFGISEIDVQGLERKRKLLTGKSLGGTAKDFRKAKLDEFKPGYNQGCVQFINSILTRHGATLQTSNARNKIAIVAPTYDQETAYRFVKGLGGNVKTSTASRDYSRLPSVTLALGRGAKLGRGGTTIKGDLSIFDYAVGANEEFKRIARNNVYDSVRRESEVGDNKAYRPLFYQDKKARNLEQLARGLNRLVSELIRKTLEYRCTVQGHTDPETGTTYAVDTMAEVYDPTEDVDETMWVMGRTFRNDGNSGAVTDLTLIRPVTFVL